MACTLMHATLRPGTGPAPGFGGTLCGGVLLCKAAASGLKLETGISAEHLWFSLSAYTCSIEVTALRS